MRRTGDAYLRPDLPALRAAMQRAGTFADPWSVEGYDVVGPDGKMVCPPGDYDLSRHIADCHNFFLLLANYVIFSEQRLADLRGK